MDFIYAKGGIVYSNGDNGTGWFTTTKALDTNQSFIWHRALVIDEFSDPGVFVENRSTLEVEVRAKLEPTFGSGGALKKLSISYEAKQEGGTWNQNQIANAIEPMIDKAARELNIDPLAIRKINAPNNQSKYGGSQTSVTSAYLSEALDQGAEMFNWNERRQRSGQRNGTKVTGIGIRSVNER